MRERQRKYHLIEDILKISEYLKGQCHEIFDFGFVHESDSPKPLSITLGPFQIFLNIHVDIHSSRCTTGVVDTGLKMEKIFNHKSFNYFVWTPLESRVNL
jgi:hypothetical protein